MNPDDLWAIRFSWLVTHANRMIRLRGDSEVTADTGEKRALQLEAAGNADSVLELLPLLFRRNESFRQVDINFNNGGRLTHASCSELERVAYELLNWRGRLEKNSDTFNDRGKRWFY